MKINLNDIPEGYKVAVIPILEAIKIAKEDEKELREYLKGIEECKKINISIVRKNGTKIPLTFTNKELNIRLKEEIKLAIKCIKEEATEIKELLIKMESERNK